MYVARKQRELRKAQYQNVMEFSVVTIWRVAYNFIDGQNWYKERIGRLNSYIM